MAQDNPTNPYTQDPRHTQKDVPMPMTKAKVVSSESHPGQFGFHVVRIKIYGDDSTYLAPVLAPMNGCVWVPKEGEDVAVIFGNADKPWVIGTWYAIDRTESGEVSLPSYEPGDIRVGNDTGSHVTVQNDGSIEIVTDGKQPVDVDHQSATVFMSSDQTIYGDDVYDVVQFDTPNSDPEELFDSSQNAYVLRHDGSYNIQSSVEILSPAQDNVYTLALFVNGSVIREKTEHSAVNEAMTLSVSTQRKFDANDVVDVRLKQDSGTDKTVNSSDIVTEFTIHRSGI